MTDRDALYRAILDYPDDDTPRLIFADVLDEEDDPDRAAFIRAQVALAAVPLEMADDPCSVVLSTTGLVVRVAADGNYGATLMRDGAWHTTTPRTATIG